MVAAALTPRVRILAVCDEVAPSETEDGVFTLEGVRQHVIADTFPCPRDFGLFLLLSCPRRDSYAGWVRVINLENNKTVRFEKFRALFQEDNGLLSLVVNVENCVFPTSGEYAFEVWFKARNEQPAQKGELFFLVYEYED
jgi:Family of unknown function (DUF6941)